MFKLISFCVKFKNSCHILLQIESKSVHRFSVKIIEKSFIIACNGFCCCTTSCQPQFGQNPRGPQKCTQLQQQKAHNTIEQRSERIKDLQQLQRAGDEEAFTSKQPVQIPEIIATTKMELGFLLGLCFFWDTVKLKSTCNANVTYGVVCRSVGE